ncbi:MAG: ABC transporter permease [Thermoproteota archaeon]
MGRQLVIFGFLAIGETFVIVTGGIDLSVGSLTALLNVLLALFMTRGLGTVGGVLATIAIAIAFGVWHGIFVTRLRVPAFIITLGTFVGAKGLAALITKGWPISGLPTGFSLLWEGMVLKVIPVPVLIFIAIAVLAHFLLGYTVWGRHLYAIGGDIEAARRFGIKINALRIMAYVISALCAGIVALLIAARLNQGNPTVGTLYEMYAIAAVVIGGASLFGGEGSIIGSIVGACIITVLWNALVLMRVSAYWHEVTVGTIIVSAVTVDILRRRRTQQA